MEAQPHNRLSGLALAGSAAVLSAAAWATGDGLPLRGAAFRLGAWAAAAAIGAVYALSWGAGSRRAAGMALMWVPVTRTAIAIANDAAILTTGGQVLPAFSHHQLSSFYIHSIMRNLGYLGAGFLLWSGWHPRDTLHVLARRLRSTGAPLVRTSEGRDMRIGLAVFPVLLVVAYFFNAIVTSSLPQLVNSDETSIWRNVTPWHAIMISAAAALGEEALYRVFLMTALAAVLARFRLPGHLPWVGAVAGQAVFFGFAHASYGNWLHVIEASLFGLLAGIAALWLGIWVPVVLHFLIDVYAIGGHATDPFWSALLVAFFVINAAYAAWSLVQALRIAWSRSATG